MRAVQKYEMEIMENKTQPPNRVRHALLVAGFSSYWLWTFFVFIAKVIPQRQALSVFEDSWFWSTLGHIIALSLVIAIARFYAPFGSKRGIVIGSPLVCLLGYGLLLYSSLSSTGALGSLLLGSALSGVGNAGLLVCWCETYTETRKNDGFRFVIALAILLSIIAFILLSFLPPLILWIVLALLPFITICTTHYASKRSPVVAVKRNDTSSLSPYFAIFCLIYALPLGYFQIRFSIGFSQAQTDWTTLLLPAFFLIAILVTIDALLMKRFGTSILAQAIVPITIAGFLLLSIFDVEGKVSSGILIYTSQQFIAIYFYNLFASLAANGRAIPAKTFAIGIVFIDSGYIIGQLIGEIAQSFLDSYVLELTLGLLYLTAMVGVFILPRVTDAAFSRHNLQKQQSGTILDQTHFGERVQGLERIIDHYSLTMREEDMLRYLLKGKSVPAIARETFLSQNTVKTHISHIYQKLNVHSRDELIEHIESF
jgi:DNA-binding CsgD family transcriptional regulator